MTKKTFIALADVIRRENQVNRPTNKFGGLKQTQNHVSARDEMVDKRFVDSVELS